MIGEMIIYDADDNYNYERFKIGDGVRNVNELPFSEADWNAAEGEPGHILNKPTFIDEKVLLDLSIAESYNDGTFGKAWVINKAPHLTLGEIYTINYNGIDYNCECVTAPSGFTTDPDAVALGNMSAAGGANTGEPFAMLISELYERIDIIDLVSSESVNIKIYKDIQYIDPKYIPDMYYTEGVTGVEVPVFGMWSTDGNDEDGDGVIDNPEIGYYITAPIGLEVGKKYIVNWNGVDYEVVGQDALSATGEMPGVLLGDETLGKSGTQREPFILVDCGMDISGGQGLYGMAMDFSNVEVPFTIYCEEEIVHQLDPKFIPDMYYSETKVEENKFILGPTTVELSNGEVLVAQYLQFVVGETYTVNWNGADYVCVAQDASSVQAGVVLLGNGESFDLTGNGEPFIVASLTGEGTVVMALEDISSVDLYIRGRVVINKIQKLDNKYLDLDWLPTKELIEIVPETTVEHLNGWNDFGYNMLGSKNTSLVVTMDGVNFPTQIVTLGSGIDSYDVCGNLGLLNQEFENTGEPFVAMVNSNTSLFMFGDGAAHQIAISAYEANKLPPEFLPEGLDDASHITKGTLAVSRGGTGLTSSPSMLVNLGSNNTAGVFTLYPRPGVTGILQIKNGGTGADNAASARENLGVPPKSHAATTEDYGVGNSTNYGHLRVSDDVSSESTTGTAVSPKAVFEALQKRVGIEPQTLTDEQKAQARSNIGAVASDDLAKPDWNAKEGEPGHVLNRTHWVEKCYKVLVSRRKIHFPSDMSYGSSPYSISETYLPKIGTLCRVTWDGVPYEVAITFGSDESVSNAWAGNRRLISSKYSTNGLPFGLKFYDNSCSIYSATKTDGVEEYHEIVIEVEEIVCHKLPEKYLPDSIYDWNSHGRDILYRDILINKDIDLAGNSAYSSNSLNEYIKIGTLCRVTWDGVPYEVISSPYWNGDKYRVCLGNPHIAYSEYADNGLPFCILTFKNANLGTYAEVYSATKVDGYSEFHTYSVEIGEYTYNKLPEGYLPDNIANWDAPEGEYGHIINRTHGREVVYEEYVAERIVLFYPSTRSYTIHSDLVYKNIKIGVPCRVTWDGILYEVVSTHYWYTETNRKPRVCIGNMHLIKPEFEDNGLPFCVDIEVLSSGDSNGKIYYVAEVDGEEHTYRLEVGEYIYHRLHEKYLPESVLDWTFWRNDNYVEYVPEKTISYPANNTNMKLDYSDMYSTLIKEGVNCRITWDGVPYEVVTAYHDLLDDDRVYVGNPRLAHSGAEDNGLPFCLEFFTDGSDFCIVYSATKSDRVAETHTYRLEVGDYTYNKLPEEYLPESVITAPTDMSAGDLLMYDGTNFVKLSKADLIAEIIAALPKAEEASF